MRNVLDYRHKQYEHVESTTGNRVPERMLNYSKERKRLDVRRRDGLIRNNSDES
jgi:hypothetical protein